MKINRINLLKSFDSTVGPFLIRVIPLLKKKKPFPTLYTDNLKVLLIRPGGIGDAVLLVPAIQRLKRSLPCCLIDVLAERRNWEIFRMCRDVSGIYLYDKPGQLLKTIRNDYQIVIDTEQWHRLSAVIAYLTKAPIRIGFSTNERKELFSHPVAYSHDDYEVYSFFNLLYQLFDLPGFGADSEASGYSPEVPFLEVDGTGIAPWLTDLVSENIKKHEKGFVVISPGATVRERRWGGENYGEVARRLLSNNFGVIVIGTMADRADAEIIREKAGDTIDLTGRTGLKEVAYILKKSRLFIGPDSGVLHIAVGLGTPTVSLFGSGIARKWAPRGKNHIVINKNLPCSPCTRFGYTPECRRGIKCLTGITHEEVVASAFKLIECNTKARL